MSKKSKAWAKKERLKKKQAKKATLRALYESYRDKGTNTKSHRAKQNKTKKAIIKVHKHKQSNCGNAGCQRCSGLNFNPFLKDGKPKGMPQFMYRKYLEAA